MRFELPDPWPTNPWPTKFRTVRVSPPDALGASGPRFVTVQSPALGGRGDVAIHHGDRIALGPDPPVVVLLHGVYGSFWNWMLAGRAHETLDRLVAEERVRPMVLVAPTDGLAGEGTAYLVHPEADYERWVMHDVVECVAEFVDEVSDRSPLFLAGNSMGAFGACRLGMRHERRVAGIAMHSAITHLDQLAAFTVADVGEAVGLPSVDRDLLTSIDEAAEPPPLFIDCGRRDPLYDANVELHEQLERRHIPHRFHDFDGGHDWDAWSARIEHSLSFFESVMTPDA